MKQLFFIFACVAIISCSVEDSQLDRTIFVPDEKDMSLPAYTEWGYNSFGAKYERDYFLASQKIIPCKIMYRNDSLQILMSGIYGKSYSQDNMSLIFSIPYEKITNYSELMILNQKRIDLGSNCVVEMILNDNRRILDGLSGELNFKRVQMLSVDDVVNRVIISGTFEVKFLGVTQFPESFSDGRFDFGITNNEFYYTPN